jgi:alpha/beta superfamily hydrolase
VTWRLRAVGAAVTGWVAINVLSAYGAANPWVTDRVWPPKRRHGALAAAVPGRDVCTDGVVGHFVEPRPGFGVVVVVHGHGDDRNADPVVTVSTWLHDFGYGVFAIDLGYLDGRHRFSAGRREAGDVSAAIDWLDSENLDAAGVWGFSAGAHATLVAAATDERIPRVIADSPYVDGGAQVRMISARTVHLPARAFPIVAVAIKLFSGEWPVDLRKAQWPGTRVLVIQGTDDAAVAPGDAEQIALHTGGEIVRFEGVGHTQAHTLAADDYRTAAMRFLNRETNG